MEREERIEIYMIPPNFAEEGTMLSGRIRTKNAVETAAMLLVLVPLLLCLDMTVKTKMYIAMIVLVPIGILGILGIQGESLFAFIGSFFRYLTRRRFLTVPDERYRLEQNRRRKQIGKGETKIHGRQKSQTNPEPDMETGIETGQARSETRAKSRFPWKRRAAESEAE